MEALEIINGKFGARVLKPKYRKIWKSITHGVIILAGLAIMVQFFNLWDKAVDFLNYIIWG